MTTIPPVSPTFTPKPYMLSPKDAVDLLIASHERAHSFWRIYAGSALVLVGWLFSISDATLRGRRVLLTVAIVAGTVISIVSTVAAYRYLRAVIAEASAAAKEVEFRTRELGLAIARVQVMPTWMIVTVQVVVCLLVLSVMW